MFDRRHPWGGYFIWCSLRRYRQRRRRLLLPFSEYLLGGRTGAEKKDAAMSFFSAALQLSDAVTARHIVDEDKFKLGLSNVIDGVVLCTPCFDVFEASAA
jgi:hypothetical protein